MHHQSTNCIFCQIAQGQAPSYTFWQNDDFQAFLSIFPNTAGVSVVIPKQHYSSDVTQIPEDVFNGLCWAARHVAHLLTQKLTHVGRCAIVFEGMGVPHAHAKVFPMHGTVYPDLDDLKKQQHALQSVYYDRYPGYISTHDGQLADANQLSALCKDLKA